MSSKNITLTQAEADKIRTLLWNAESSIYQGSPHLKKLEQELNQAIIVEPGQTQADVISIGSTAEMVDVGTGEEMKYTLVFPEAADLSQGRISVLAPIGTAMLGYQVGDTFEWETPMGKRVIYIEKISSPSEAAGDAH